MTREELIAALEKATGADRVLDFWCWWWGKATHDGKAPDSDYVAANIRSNDAPRYTASIDAALTLVPEGLGWGIPYGPCKEYSGTRERIWWEAEVGPATAEAFTPALALCIAALKARGDTP